MPEVNAVIRTQEVSDGRWARNLSDIATTYGKLVYLAGLRNPDTGRYEHYGTEPGYGTTVANRGLRRIHEGIFRGWVNIPLEHKMADVQLYISTIDVERAELVDAWLRLQPYRNLVPASIQGPERLKHISDFEAILGLLRNMYGVSCLSPNA